MPEFIVSGIVSSRDRKPYIQLMDSERIICQLSMNEASYIAMDILIQCSRCEMDAMVNDFFSSLEAPDKATGAAMALFREYRAAIDAEKV